MYRLSRRSLEHLVPLFTVSVKFEQPVFLSNTESSSGILFFIGSNKARRDVYVVLDAHIRNITVSNHFRFNSPCILPRRCAQDHFRPFSSHALQLFSY
jgi:hypothetical protein